MEKTVNSKTPRSIVKERSRKSKVVNHNNSSKVVNSKTTSVANNSTPVETTSTTKKKKTSIILNVENNNFVNVGDNIATLYSNSPINPDLEKEFYDNLEFLEKSSEENIPKINTIIR